MAGFSITATAGAGPVDLGDGANDYFSSDGSTITAHTALTSLGAVTGTNLSGTNTGNITLAAVGSTPSANGASLSAQVLTLQPADGSTPGLLTAGTQTIGGAKTFSAAAVFSLGLTIPTAQTLKLNAGGTTTLQDGSGNLRIDVAAGRVVQMYVDGTDKCDIGANLVMHGLGTFDSGLQIPTGMALSLNTGNTSQIQDSSGDIRVDVATGKAVKIYVNSVLKHTLDTNATHVGTVGGSNLSGTNTGDVTIGTANGLSVSSQALSMAAAGSSTIGAVTSSAQSFGGAKTFDAAATFSAGLTVPTANAINLNAGATTKIADSSGVMRFDVATGNSFKHYVNNVLVLTVDNGNLTPAVDLHMGNYDTWAKKITPDNTNSLQLNGRTGDHASDIGIKFGQNSAMTAGSDRYIAAFYLDNASTTEFALYTNGKFQLAAVTLGTATLSSGTVTVSTAAVKTGDIIFLSVNTPGGTGGIHYSAPVASIVDGTSFVINSVSAAGTVVTTDTSTINWWIVDSL